MYRSLRFQLIAIVTVTVATVLAASQWLDTSLSERTLEHDMRERAIRALDIVSDQWGRSDADDFARTLATLARGNREFEALDVFVMRADGAEVAATTRSDGAQTILDPHDMQALRAGTTVTTRLPGEQLWRIAVPLRRAGAVIGAAQVDVSLAEAAGLKARLRAIDTVFLVISIVAISFLLAVFLERRVGRPVTALVGGMRRAEGGVLGVRVTALGGGEFGFLAGRFNRMLGSIEDLTTGLEARVRHATQELADKNRELQETNEKLWRAQLEMGRSERLAALGQMAATLAHELGTPLNSVLGYTQLLLREQPTADQAAKLAILESQVQRMIETMRSVLDRTRELRRGPVAVGPLVSEALALVSSRLAGRRLAVRSEVAPDLPTVPADASGLRQVLLNLLTNAIDATPPGGRIDVTTRRLPGNGEVEIAVADTGRGIDPAHRAHLFEPFFSTKEPEGGTGLGLFISAEIVREHKGRIDIDSAEGRGSTFRVCLPGVERTA